MIESVLESHGPCESFELSIVQIGDWKQNRVTNRERNANRGLSLGTGGAVARPARARGRARSRRSPAILIWGIIVLNFETEWLLESVSRRYGDPKGARTYSRSGIS